MNPFIILKFGITHLISHQIALHSVQLPLLIQPLFFSTNMAVDQHNHDIFHKSTNEKVEIKAIDIVLGDLSHELKGRLKKQIPNDPSKTMGLYSICSVLKDAKYDLTTNVSVIDGMTNGAECIIKKVDYRVPRSLRPSIIWVLFQEEHI